MRLERRRDGQQWILDWLVKQTGREQNFEYDARRFPASVKNYAMIPAAMLKLGMHRERMARAAQQQGHDETARQLYFRAVGQYHAGQHAIFADDDPDKLYLYERLTECYDRLIELSENRIERVEVPWGDVSIAGNLHLAPAEQQRPAVLLLPGMDMSKEVFPDPADSVFAKRGMHLLVIDGPGQGVSNLRKIRVTADNYERAASTAYHYLRERPEVDAERVGVAGVSMGSFWSMRLAALDPAVKAVASAAACYSGKAHIFERSSPRFKQMFMYMAGIHDEDEFDRMAEQMHLDGYAQQITCPCLMMAGEYDPLTPLEDTQAIFDQVAGPKELMVLENDFHGTGRGAGGLANFGGLTPFHVLADWLGDVLTGARQLTGTRTVLVPEADGEGPYSPPVSDFSLRTRFPPPA